MRDLDNFQKTGPLFVGSLAKGLLVLECFDRGRRELGITDISRLTGLEKSAANRLVSTLHKLGYLHRNGQNRRYSLSPRLLEFAFNFLSGNLTIELAMQRMISLSETSGCSVGMCVLDDTDVIYTARLERHQFYHPTSLIGERQPVYCTSGGRALLSRLDPLEARDILERADRRRITERTKTDLSELLEEVERTTRRGYAVQAGEFIHLEVNFAAPVVNGSGEPVASVLMSKLYSNDEEIVELEKELTPALLRTVDEISSGLGAKR